VVSEDQPGFVRAVAFSPDSGTIATVEDAMLRLYDAQSLRPLLKPDVGLTNVIPRLSFSPDGKFLVVGDPAGQLAVWDLPGQRRVTNFVAHTGPAVLLAFGRDGKSLLTGGMENLGKEWDVATWSETAHWPFKKRALAQNLVVGAAPATGLLAVTSSQEEGVIELFPFNDPEKRTLFPRPVTVVGIAFAPNGRTMAASCEDGSLVLWDDLHATNRTVLLRNVLLGLHSVAFSPDGQRVAAGSNGKEAVKIWDFNSREELATLEGKGSIIGGLCFSPDGNAIAAKNWMGAMLVWRAPSMAQIEAAEKAPPGQVASAQP
jgi:WD40 repeat protein